MRAALLAPGSAPNATLHRACLSIVARASRRGRQVFKLRLVHLLLQLLKLVIVVIVVHVRRWQELVLLELRLRVGQELI